MDLALVYAQLIRIDGLDIWDGLSRMGCNKVVYAEALKAFCGDLEKKRADLAESLENENWKAYASAVHAIKGGFAGIGARDLAEQVSDLEDAAKKADAGFCKKNSGAVLAKTGEFIACLRSGALFAEEAARREPVSLAYLKQKLAELYKYCASGSSTEADALAKELRSKTHSAETDTVVGSICTHVENLDYHLALEAMDRNFLGLLNNPAKADPKSKAL